MNLLREEDMFRGKFMPGFLKRYSDHYLLQVETHGRENVMKMYRWCFRALSNLRYGQYINWSKITADPYKAGLIRWCFEMIYESDLLSQMEIRTEKCADGSREKRLYLVEPTEEQRARWGFALDSEGRYLFIDWYGRLMENPKSNPDVDPKWFGLEASDADVGTDGDVGIVDDIENYNNL